MSGLFWTTGCWSGWTTCLCGTSWGSISRPSPTSQATSFIMIFFLVSQPHWERVVLRHTGGSAKSAICARVLLLAVGGFECSSFLPGAHVLIMHAKYDSGMIVCTVSQTCESSFFLWRTVCSQTCKPVSCVRSIEALANQRQNVHIIGDSHVIHHTVFDMFVNVARKENSRRAKWVVLDVLSFCAARYSMTLNTR